MTPQEIIVTKREGGALTREAIDQFVAGTVSGEFKKYQASALLMAMFLRGMNGEETQFLTEAMLASGKRVDLAGIPAPKVDKHSTGGVGDKVSLILAPLAAACGLCVPMISGRGLGHTGGTLDKLEAIPGFSTQMGLKAFRKQLERIGVAMIGQTEELVPADRELYALRDVTGTVESIPLITASILSKKAAEGIEGLVLDVKVGAGAFMKTKTRARHLAQSMVKVGARLGLRVQALLTEMDEPLGHNVGNALEVEEAIAALRGEGAADLMAVTLELTAAMLQAGKVFEKRLDALRAARRALEKGLALEKFRQLVEAQGGDPAVVDNPRLLPHTRRTVEVKHGGAGGWVQAVDALGLARLAMELGAGRRAVNDPIDPAVGLSALAKRGQRVEEGEVLGVLHLAKGQKAEPLVERVRAAFTVQSEPCRAPRPVLERIP